MNVKRFIIAGIAVFVAFEVMNIIIHSVILMGTYVSLREIWRPDMAGKLWIMYLADLVFAFLFTYIFIKGYENRGWIEGLRYWIWIGILVSVVGSFIQYVIYPIPLSLAIQWAIYGFMQIVICGIIAALIYRPAA
jgi:hypothetical protein